jgi:hypothetical protein
VRAEVTDERDRDRRRIPLAAVLLLAGPALAGTGAAAPEPADEEFLQLLEFLGEWAGDDADFETFFDSLPERPDEGPRLAAPATEDTGP